MEVSKGDARSLEYFSDGSIANQHRGKFGSTLVSAPLESTLWFAKRTLVLVQITLISSVGPRFLSHFRGHSVQVLHGRVGLVFRLLRLLVGG